MAQARARFEERFPEFRNKARKWFRDFGPEARDDAVANSLFLTWHYFPGLVEQGRATDALSTATFYYSMRQTRSGRMMKTVRHGHFRELFGHQIRDGESSTVNSLDCTAPG
jgi:hypothetical protein